MPRATIEPGSEEYQRDCVSIQPEDLDSEFCRVAADIAYWNAQYADANRSYLFAKIEADRVRGMLYFEHREALELMGKKVTEAQVGALVDTDPRQIDARTDLVETEARKVRLRGVCDAVIAKKDMIQSLGAKLRAEMAGDPTLRRDMNDFRHGGA